MLAREFALTCWPAMNTQGDAAAPQREESPRLRVASPPAGFPVKHDRRSNLQTVEQRPSMIRLTHAQKNNNPSYAYE